MPCPAPSRASGLWVCVPPEQGPLGSISPSLSLLHCWPHLSAKSGRKHLPAAAQPSSSVNFEKHNSAHVTAQHKTPKWPLCGQVAFTLAQALRHPHPRVLASWLCHSGLSSGHLLGEVAPIPWSKAAPFCFQAGLLSPPNLPTPVTPVWNSNGCRSHRGIPGPRQGLTTEPKEVHAERAVTARRAGGVGWVPAAPRRPLPSALLSTAPLSKSPMLHPREGPVWGGGPCCRPRAQAPKPRKGQAHCP